MTVMLAETRFTVAHETGSFTAKKNLSFHDAVALAETKGEGSIITRPFQGRRGLVAFVCGHTQKAKAVVEAPQEVKQFLAIRNGK